MNLPHKLGPDRSMHRTVARNAAEGAKLGRIQTHPEMRLPLLGRARMTPVLRTFVNDFKVFSLKGLIQTAAYL